MKVVLHSRLIVSMTLGCLTLIVPGLGCGGPGNNSTSAVGGSSPAVDPSHRVIVQRVDPLDPCANRIQDIGGALLAYDHINHHLPSRLDELLPIDDSLSFVCPATGKPYVYVPEGLDAPGQDLRIYLYDAQPTPSGIRWCAVTRGSAISGASACFAEPIPESKFNLYRPITDLTVGPATP